MLEFFDHKLFDQTLDASLASHIYDRHSGFRFVTAGSLAPDQVNENLVGAFHIYSTYYEPEAALMALTSLSDDQYSLTVRNTIRELNLDNFWLTGSLNRSQVATVMNCADGLVVTGGSRELIPVVKYSMSLGKPIICTADWASEIFDKGGIALRPDATASLVAEAMFEVKDNESLRRRFAKRTTARALGWGYKINPDAYAESK